MPRALHDGHHQQVVWLQKFGAEGRLTTYLHLKRPNQKAKGNTFFPKKRLQEKYLRDTSYQGFFCFALFRLFCFFLWLFVWLWVWGSFVSSPLPASHNKWMDVAQCEIIILVISRQFLISNVLGVATWMYSACATSKWIQPRADETPCVSLLEGQCICYLCCVLGWNLTYFFILPYSAY